MLYYVQELYLHLYVELVIIIEYMNQIFDWIEIENGQIFFLEFTVEKTDLFSHVERIESQ